MISDELKKEFLACPHNTHSVLLKRFLQNSIEQQNLDGIMLSCAMYDAPHVLRAVLKYSQSSKDQCFNALYNAACNGHLECVQILWRKAVHTPQDGYRVLSQALMEEQYAVANYALDQGVDPNSEDQILLGLCIYKGNRAMVEKLMELCDYHPALKKLQEEHPDDYLKWQWFDEMIKARNQKQLLEKSLRSSEHHQKDHSKRKM